ncbi:MAG TPA: hypothetical protein P5267_02225 [Patescibacteria group bacterium]|nr:hypothetical protein [Patescibacteria group bacterium]
MNEENNDLRDPISWSFPEHEKYDRSRRWYITAGVIGIILLAYALLSGNWLFALIIIMVAMVMFINHHSAARQIEFVIDHEGIRLGARQYKYSEIKNFWLVYDPKIAKKIFFVFKSSTRPILIVPIDQENPVNIRSFLRQYLEEDLEQEAEPFSEAMGRILKI